MITDLGRFPFAGPTGTIEVPKVHSDLWGGIWAPETLPELMHVLAESVGRAEEMGGWRGQPNIDWRIDSSGLRRVHTFGPLTEPEEDSERIGLPANLSELEEDSSEMASAQLESDLREYEEWLLNEARLVGHGFHSGRALSDLELLAVTQHYGAATRLIDLSRNAFVALYFACAENADDYGLLIGFDTEITGRVASEADLLKPMGQLLDESSGYTMTWEPRHLFERMRVQQSFFLFSKVYWSRWGSIALTGPPKDQDDEIDADAQGGDLTLIAIPPALKAEGIQLQQHALFGYDGKSLFPDLEGFARFNSVNRDFVAR